MSNAINGITKFALDRGIHKMTPTDTDVSASIVEELLELRGYDVPKQLRSKLKEAVEQVFQTENLEVVLAHKEPTTEDKVDALLDIAVFALTEVMKHGYDPELGLREVAREINSREGEIVNGKFEKYLTDEAKSRWYKADFKKAKVELIEVVEDGVS